MFRLVDIFQSIISRSHVTTNKPLAISDNITGYDSDLEYTSTLSCFMVLLIYLTNKYHNMTWISFTEDTVLFYQTRTFFMSSSNQNDKMFLSKNLKKQQSSIDTFSFN